MDTDREYANDNIRHKDAMNFEKKKNMTQVG